MGWILLAKVPVKEFTIDKTNLTIQIYLIGIILLVVAIFLSNVVSITITKPIKLLIEMVKGVAEGDLEMRVDVANKDEVGLLSKEFNRMVQKTSALVERVYQEEKEKREFEFAMLQAQINPHFLYNTLENICGLAELDRFWRWNPGEDQSSSG
ncbi:HAMP domain-containing protein [Paenibacillus psychroresistens]|uniref:HAMP domain-containing protein n=1 Tax=Paenibacillus psychroresistens TaxID=1778678 RepID=A0A6B8RHL8_9BACL|nr:HAMP domain-containing protein [Paenibacillus psychroresistens]QGQ95095.1 HAMP domain-containing protein [Paenibacillus psychroresistens]